MNLLAILALVDKGLAIVSLLIEAGQPAKVAIDAVKALTERPRQVTLKMLEDTEAVLDAQIAEFNLELPA